jgi:hypothetical protein
LPRKLLFRLGGGLHRRGGAVLFKFAAPLSGSHRSQAGVIPGATKWRSTFALPGNGAVRRTQSLAERTMRGRSPFVNCRLHRRSRSVPNGNGCATRGLEEKRGVTTSGRAPNPWWWWCFARRLARLARFARGYQGSDCSKVWKAMLIPAGRSLRRLAGIPRPSPEAPRSRRSTRRPAPFGRRTRGPPG